MKQFLLSFLRFCVDRVFPWAWRPSADESEKEVKRQAQGRKQCEESLAHTTSASDLTAPLAGIVVLLENERNRQQSVDTRLTSIIGLSSIAGTVVVGTSISGALGRIAPGVAPRLMSIGIAYLVLQLCCAIVAAIQGLARRDYHHLDVADLLRGPSESELDQARREITISSGALEFNRAQTNDKFAQMARAHCALKNFIWVLLFVALAGGVESWVSPPKENDLVQQLKTNHELHELLRGPQGPAGEIGPQGLRGLQGPPGQQAGK